MKRVSCAVLILTVVIVLMMPLPVNAGGGHGGPPPPGPGGWWVPWAVIGGVVILSSYFYSRFYEPPKVIIQEQPPVYFQTATSVTPSPSEKIFVYPRLGQSEALQAKDRDECHNWAVSQTNHDPTHPSTLDMTEAQRNQVRADYQRAQSACLDGRGYTVK